MQPARTQDVVLFNGTVTSSGTGAWINLPASFQGASVILTTSTVSGSSPTFDVYLQRQLPAAAATDTPPGPPTGTMVADDVFHFKQQTGAATYVVNLMPTIIQGSANATTATTVDYAISQAALTAESLRIGGTMCDWWRVNIVVGGTTPSAFVSVVARLYSIYV